MSSPMVVGSSGEIIAEFLVPTSSDTSSAAATWTFETHEGIAYATGTVTTFTAISHPRGTRLKFVDTLNIPTNAPASLLGEDFILRWNLELGTASYNYDTTIEVHALTQARLGAESAVDIAGSVSKLYATLPIDTTAIIEVYDGNTLLYSGTQASSGENDQGHSYAHVYTFYATASLNPLSVIWKYEHLGRTVRSAASIWAVNPSILSAADELRNWMNRLHVEARLQEVDFDIVDLLRWLQMGRDMFNAIGFATNITMTNSVSANHYFWMTCSEIRALRNQYLVEGMRSFNFSGQSVTLDVDVTQYLESVASALQSEVDQNLIPYKKQLKEYNITGGDGSAIPGVTGQRRQSGAVGISMGPASNIGYGARGYRGFAVVRPR